MKRDIKDLMAVLTINKLLSDIIKYGNMTFITHLMPRLEKATESYDDSREDFDNKEYVLEVLTAACEVLENKDTL